ncbi:MAG: putative transcriptional regulator [Polaribacter sp.]|jgi:putative transcriptional regulator
MSKFLSFKNQLLIAMPQLDGSDFNQSIALVCEHNEKGAMGIVINQALSISTTELLEQMNIEYQHDCIDPPVLSGGPVQTDRGFVVHRSKSKNNKNWKSSIDLSDGVSITTSSDILYSIGKNEIASDVFIALGYAGWRPGQLENEIISNSWINIPMNPQLLFETDVQSRWNKATSSLGFNLDQLTYYSGNA